MQLVAPIEPTGRADADPMINRAPSKIALQDLASKTCHPDMPPGISSPGTRSLHPGYNFSSRKNGAGLRKIAARIVGTAIAPLLHQSLKVGVVAVGQHDAGGEVEITGSTAGLRQALAPQAKAAAA